MTDKMGRKRLFMITLALYLLATIATSISLIRDFAFSLFLFALATMRKDFSLIMRLAAELSVAIPATAAEQMYAAALAQGYDEDYSVMIQFMEVMAGVKL